MNALVLSPEAPYPLAGGGALRTASLLHYLARRYEVDLIIFRQPGEPDPAHALPAGLVRRVSVIDLKPNGRSFAARSWRNAARVARSVPPLVDRFSGYARSIESALENSRYAVAVIEHFWCAPYIDQFSRVSERTVLNLHNIESVLHARCASTENGPAGLAHRMFQQASLALERTWLPRFSDVLTTSEQDAEQARAIAPGARTTVYPNALRPCPPPERRGEQEAIVFSGNMEYHPNRSAVRYFRREIWPLLRDRWPALVWRLVGKNPNAVREFTAGDPRIEVSGPVEDAIREIAKARVAVVPLLAGSGTRLKILEAWAAGTPVISTTVGAEGLPVGPLVLADTAPAFAQGVTRLLSCNDTRQNLGTAGRLLLEKEFTWETAWKKLTF